MTNQETDKKTKIFENLSQIMSKNQQNDPSESDNQNFEKSKHELFQKAETFPMMDTFIESKIKKNRDFWKKKYQLQLPNLFPGEESVPIKQKTYQKHIAENHENDPQIEDCEFC